MTNFLPETAVPFPNAYVVDVTPELAQSWLDANQPYHTVSEYRVQKLAAQMRAGHWRLDCNGIAFAKNGTLLDGLHRLLAVVRSGKTVPMIVIINEPIENMDVIDNRHLNK